MAPTLWTSRTGPVLDMNGDTHPIGLEYEDLAGYDFTDADLKFADLYGANLQRANFTRANLSGSYIFGANRNFAIFNNTILLGVREDKDPHRREDLFLDQ
jgi:uncharacterized protein YjbI with pentapeptide repeats